MRKILLASLFVIFTLPSAARAASPPAKEEKDAGIFSELINMGEAKVEAVIDPLTIRLSGGKTIRLAGLDYPDLDPYAPGPLAETAQKILTDFLLGKHVTIFQTKNPKTGRMTRMGHEIAHLTRKPDGIWVQGMLLGLGLARVRTERTNPEMTTPLYELENSARQEKLGLWSIEAYSIATPDTIAARTGTFQIVEGQILTVSRKQNRIYLNFGTNWRKDFTISIAPDSLRTFRTAGVNPLDWSGKTVRVRGWVGSYNGPYIEIDHPQPVQVIETAPQTEENTKPRKEAPKPPETEKKPKKSVFGKGNALPGLSE